MVTQEKSRIKLKSVMLIDDNEIDNFINQKVLDHYCKSDIITFTSSIDALDYLRQTANIPDLILLDLYLPIMNGFEFLNEFVKLEKNILDTDVIILSVSVNPNDLEIAKQKKCTGYIEKPLTIEKIMKLLKHKKESQALINCNIV